MHVRALARTAPLLLALQLAGCVRWVAEPNPRAALAGHGHREVRVSIVDGRTLLLRDPQVSRDSLFGWSHFPGPRMGGRIALPLADVARVERRVSNRRPLAVAAILAVVGLTVAAKP
ncbi:MAG: hypothetical protein JWM27_4412 [Gemmatimonadetes bacterium]|nr:hypothetical protein [Gemmatimonadota bacterium]